MRARIERRIKIRFLLNHFCRFKMYLHKQATLEGRQILPLILNHMKTQLLEQDYSDPADWDAVELRMTKGFKQRKYCCILQISWDRILLTDMRKIYWSQCRGTSGITLSEYTSDSINSYRYRLDTVTIVDSSPTTFAGQPVGHLGLSVSLLYQSYCTTFNNDKISSNNNPKVSMDNLSITCYRLLMHSTKNSFNQTHTLHPLTRCRCYQFHQSILRHFHRESVVGVGVGHLPVPLLHLHFQHPHHLSLLV